MEPPRVAPLRLIPAALQRWWRQRLSVPEVPAPLWRSVLERYPFLHTLPPTQQDTLRHLCQHFLAHKEFHTTGDLVLTDEVALSIAAQACLPLLHWGLAGLDWYDDFVGIVVHPDAVLARREVVDEAGVVHRYREVLAGEAMSGGPVMLVWSQVQGDAARAGTGHNLVIHEFAHKLDMCHKRRDEAPNGTPRLPAGWLGMSAAAARAHWQTVWSAAYESFCAATEMAERFGTPAPWLDAYGATDPAEFFAVCCEAYFVNPERFAEEFPTLPRLLDAFFQRPAPDINAATRP